MSCLRRRKLAHYSKRGEFVVVRRAPAYLRWHEQDSTCHLISRPDARCRCSCLIIDVVLVVVAVHCANYHHDCLTMRKNATLPSRHRYCHWLFRVFMNHPIDERDLRERREGYEKKDIADRLSFSFFLFCYFSAC